MVTPVPRRMPRLLGALSVGAFGLLGLVLTTGSLHPAHAGAAESSVPVPDMCTAFPHPPMPPSTGTQTPAGFSIEMPNASLAPTSQANTLAFAYSEWTT